MLINMRGGLMAGKRLPYDAEVEYIESTGTQWIDTGVNVTTSTGFEITAKFNSTAMGVFGAVLPSPTGSTRFHFGRRDNVVGSNKLFWGIWSGTYYGRSSTIDYSTEHLFKYVPSQSSSFFVDTSAYAIGYQTQRYYPSESRLFYLFATSDLSSAAALPCSALCYGAKFYDGSTLVRDFIPVRVGNVGYMYDRVSGKLFGNEGTGDFVLGSDVVPVEYIESHGTEWIDTGVVPTANTNVAIDYQTLITTGTDSNAFFGSRIAAQSSALSIMQYLTGGAIRLRWDYGGSLANFVEVRSGVHAISTVGNAATYDNAESVSGGIFAASGKSIWLFAINNNGSALVPHKGLQVYLFKIYDGSTPVCSFRPVRVGTDATSWEGAMMDVLIRRIYRNQGTGAFGYGNDI